MPLWSLIFICTAFGDDLYRTIYMCLGTFSVAACTIVEGTRIVIGR